MPHASQNSSSMRFYLHRFIVSIIFRGVVVDAAFGQGQEVDYLGEPNGRKCE